MTITFKSKAHEKRFEKIEIQLAIFIEEEDIKQNGFNDVLINIGNYNISSEKINEMIDNKFVYYNKSRQIISIS